MVGVPGGSKGCGTCRKRKIRCDLQRPSCGQCRRSAKECQGYAQYAPFVLYADPATINNANSRAKSSSATAAPAEGSPALSWNDASDPEDGRSRSSYARRPSREDSSSLDQTIETAAHHAEPLSRRHILRVNADSTRFELGNESVHAPRRRTQLSRVGTPPAVLPRNFTRTAFESQLLGRFFDLYFPNSGQRNQRSGVLIPSGEVIRNAAHAKLEALRLSFLAICLTRVGQYSHDPQLIEQSMRLYGKALAHLNTLLGEETKARNDDTALACQLLGMYEMLHASQRTSGSNWRHHVNGLSLLAKARGPERHMSGMGHTLFVDTWRLNFMITAILERKRTCFSSRGWTTIPFQIKTKTIRDELIDILLGIPSLLENADTAKSLATHERTTEHAHLEENLKTSEEALARWHEKLICDHPHCRELEKRLSSLPGEDQTSLAPNETLDAHTIVMYWTACLMLTGISEMSFQMLEPTDREKTGISSTRYDPDHHATAIAHALGRFLEPSLGTHMAQMTLFPMAVCRLYFTASGKSSGPAMLHLNALFINLEAAGLPLRSFLGSAAPKVSTGPKLGFMDFQL